MRTCSPACRLPPCLPRLLRLPLSRGLLVLALACAPLSSGSALDTPLIMPANTDAAIIDPTLGTLMIVTVSDSNLIRKSFGNWSYDMDQLERRIVGEVNGETFSALRTGSPTLSPSAEEVIKLYSDKVSKTQAAAGQKDQRSQVREAEKAFWEKEHKYDGVVRTAFNGEYLMVIIPSKRGVIFYKSSGRESADLFSFGNFSPALYVTSAWKSSPEPAQLAAQMDLDDDQIKAIQGALAARADGAVPAAAECDIWCAYTGGGFIVVDSANQKIWSYEVSGAGMALTSIRSMTVDLMAPGLNTAPGDALAATTFLKAYNAQIRDLGISKFDAPFVMALVSSSQVGTGAKAGAIQANAVSSYILIQFTGLHKLLSYKYDSGSGIRLVAVRDLLMDQGLTLMARMINERQLAQGAYAEAVKLGNKDPAGCLRRLTYALGLCPALHVEAEKNNGLKNALKNDWDRLMADATKAAEEHKTKMTAIETTAQAERERLSKRKRK